MDRSIQNLLAKERERVDRQWQDRIARYARQLQAEWETFSRSVDAAVNLDLEGEEISPVFIAFDELRRLGVRFDPRFIARMEFLRGDAHDLDVDGDDDGEDEGMIDDGFGRSAAFVKVNAASLTEDD